MLDRKQSIHPHRDDEIVTCTGSGSKADLNFEFEAPQKGQDSLMVPLSIESHEEAVRRDLGSEYRREYLIGTPRGRNLREKINDNLYILYALASSMCFGFGNYMVAYGMKNWRNDYTVLFPEGFSFFLFWLIYHVTGL
jgi:hypothetical protein